MSSRHQIGLITCQKLDYCRSIVNVQLERRPQLRYFPKVFTDFEMTIRFAVIAVALLKSGLFFLV